MTGDGAGADIEPSRVRPFRRRYAGRTDPWYNPNLSLDNSRFEIEAVRPATANKYPVRVTAITHNLDNQGAPTTLMDLMSA